MKEHQINHKRAIASLLLLLAAEIAWTAACCAVRSAKGFPSRSNDCPTSDDSEHGVTK